MLVANTAIGSTVKIQVLRGSKTETLTAVVEELKDKPIEKQEDKPKANSIGLIVQDMTDELAKSFKIPKATGVIINDVAINSVAEESGFMRGDIIEEVAGTAVLNTEQFNKLISELPKDKAVLVLVRKDEGTRFLTLKIK